MRFITTWLVVTLFAVVISGDTTSSEEKSEAKVDLTTEASLATSTTEKPITDSVKVKTTRRGKLRENDGNDVATDKDMTMEDLFLIGRAIDEEEKIIQEQNQKISNPNEVENSRKTDNVNSNPEDPIESKINKDFIDIRGQEEKSKIREEISSPAIQYDDPKTEVISEPPQRFGERARKFREKIQDSIPLLQLTQGGYERPYKRSRFRERYSPRPDSSEQSKNVQQPDNKISNSKRPDRNLIVPQVAYIPSSQPPYAYGQGPLLNSPFDASARNMLALNQILPPSAQNGFLNSAPVDFPSYSTTAFQPQFVPNSEDGSIPNFRNDPNNAGTYQTFASNPFQTPSILYQNSPQIQPQPVIMDAGRNVQTQFQRNSMPTYSGYETTEDNTTPNYAPFFNSPAVSSPFQVPQNFYGNAPNAINPFNSQPISFLSQYPNFDNRISPQTFQYPNNIITGAQNNQQYPNIQPLDSDASQNQNNAKTLVRTTDKPANRDDAAPAQFGTDVQSENIANVYMRYPTAEAGYAIEENLPVQNNSDESKDDPKRSQEQQANSVNSDPYKNILNSVRSNQRINNSFNFPPDFFRNSPIDFGYQRPQDGIFAQHPDRNRETPNYPTRNFESRIPFNAITSLPENFLGVHNQQHLQQESNETPFCAKENNASVCFEDSSYPKNDILYTLSSNPFLSDRFLSPEPSLNSFAFVQRSSNETDQNDENYACEVATKYGMPLRAKNLAGMWRIIVNLEGRFLQPVRMEVCKTLGSSCTYTDSKMKTACVQKFSLQRMLTWSPSRGIYSDIYKIPVACSCQIIEKDEN